MAKTKTKPIRFAALIRVSTEQQEQKGESLKVQRESITEIVNEKFSGKIVGWYGGQEHATAGWEKKEMDRLLSDAAKKKFDAVIVDRNDRWSRDNEYSHKGLEVFKQHRIRFFSGRSEFDLYSPADLLFIEMNATIGSYFARSIRYESRRSRVKRAKKNWPSSGLLPYGRTFNKDTGKWGIDKEKQLKIQEAARRYLAGESLKNVAAEYKMDHSGLHRILMTRCGTKWIQKFKDETGEVEEIVCKIPRLLPESTIKAVLKKAEANKTYQHGPRKNKYLLSRMIFCKHCGYALFGETTRSGYTYYRHSSKQHSNKCAQNCDRPDKANNVKGDVIEQMVLTHLFDMFGNPLHVQRAIEKATPNMEKIETDRRRLIQVEAMLQKIGSDRNKLIEAVCDGIFTKEQIQAKSDKLNERETVLATERERLSDSLVNIPSSKNIKKASRNISIRMGSVKRRAMAKLFTEMTYEEKRALLEMVFSEKTADGRRMGIYVSWTEPKKYTFDIHGTLIDKEDLLPLSKAKRKAYFDFDETGYGYMQKELLDSSNNIVSSIKS